MKKTSNYYGTYMRVLQETPKKTSGYYANYMRVLQRMTNVNNHGCPICGYCKRCEKDQRLLWALDAGIARNAKNTNGYYGT